MKQVLNQHSFSVEFAHYRLCIALLGSSEDIYFEELSHTFQEGEEMWPVGEAV